MEKRCHRQTAEVLVSWLSMKDENEPVDITRRKFVEKTGATWAALGMAGASAAIGVEPPIPGFEKAEISPEVSNDWQPFSDRKVRVGIAGYGLCKFGAHFGFQNHPNVEVVAVTDLDPERCAQLAKVCGCEKTYPSCEKMIEDEQIEAVFKDGETLKIPQFVL